MRKIDADALPFMNVRLKDGLRSQWEIGYNSCLKNIQKLVQAAETVPDAIFDNGVVAYPLEGKVYYVATTEESDEAWVCNKPIQYIDKEGYHCGWGMATLCFKFEDLGTVFFFSRKEAEAHCHGNTKEENID